MARLKTTQIETHYFDQFLKKFSLPVGEVIYGMSDSILFERPVLAPCYILFGRAQELGIVNQVFKIITDYQLEYIRD